MKKYLLIIFCFSAFSSLFGQELSDTDKETDDFIDSLFQDKQTLAEVLESFKKYHFLYASMNYNNKTYFSGRDVGVNQYNLNPRLSYLHHSGLFGAVSAVYYEKFDPNWDLTTATIGYGKSFGKDKIFKYQASYTRYFYNNSIANSFVNDINAGIGVKNKKKNLGTTLSASYLFGNDKAFQIVSSSFVLFKLWKTSKCRLDFRPQFSLISGDQTIEQARINFQNGRPITTYTSSKKFDVVNKYLSIPLQFNYNSFDFELGYTINFPHALGTETNLKNTNYFNFSAAYLFDL